MSAHYFVQIMEAMNPKERSNYLKRLVLILVFSSIFFVLFILIFLEIYKEFLTAIVLFKSSQSKSIIHSMNYIYR
jgi:hypothetical protein